MFHPTKRVLQTQFKSLPSPTGNEPNPRKHLPSTCWTIGSPMWTQKSDFPLSFNEVEKSTWSGSTESISFSNLLKRSLISSFVSRGFFNCICTGCQNSMIMWYDVKNLCECIHGNPTCCCGQEGREGGGKSTLKTAYNFWTGSDEIYIYIYLCILCKKEEEEKEGNICKFWENNGFKNHTCTFHSWHQTQRYQARLGPASKRLFSFFDSA